MYNAQFFGSFDVVSLILTIFVLFFAGLMVYIRREDRREGYPLEDDVSGRLEPAAGLFSMALPKTFDMPGDETNVHKPNGDRDSWELAATRRRVAGTPLQPTGDAMLAGVGPGGFALRAKFPDMMVNGAVKIAPMRSSEHFFVDRRDADPRGMPVLGADRKPAGVVADVWIDRAEVIIRYLEVELAAPAPSLTVVGQAGAGRRVLLPMAMASIDRGGRRVLVDAITAAQFAAVPALGSTDQVTRDEEERITAYFGAGYLYATPMRTEPLL